MGFSVLFEFLKEQENAPLKAGDMSAMRHESPEGGNDTVGFGHKLTNVECLFGAVYGRCLEGLTLNDAEYILAKDVEAAEARVKRKLLHEHDADYDELSDRRKMMLIDYEFNVRGGISSFPTFTGAVIAGDRPLQLQEMTRHFTDPQGTVKPLARNRAFYSTFMTDEAIRALGD